MPHLHIIYASTSGNTEYVIDVLKKHLEEKQQDLEVTTKLAEQADVEDFSVGDFLLLASGTWNTGGREGQMNPHMFLLCHKRAKEIDLAGKHCFVIGLGDERYKYTARATEHLAHFIKQHNGHIGIPPLVIVNDPYGQEDHVHKWGDALLKKLPELAS